MEIKNTFTSYKHHIVNNQVIQKSVSSIQLCDGSQNFSVREAKSFTGAIGDLKMNTIKETDHEEIINCQEEFYNDKNLIGNEIHEGGYETREVLSNQIFLVRDEMLTYRGKRYSLNDIAIKWKKDCRMWLWKSNKLRIKSREAQKFQNLKLQ